jgi:hypothetical protein
MLTAFGLVLACALPALGAERRGAGGVDNGVLEGLGRTGWRIKAATPKVPPQLDRVIAMLPESLRPLVQARLNGNPAASRPKPGATSMFAPSTLVPLWQLEAGRELGVCWGNAGRVSVDERTRAGVVVLYVGAPF